MNLRSECVSEPDITLAQRENKRGIFMRNSIFLLGCLGIFLSAAASAQECREGRWEITSQNKTPDGGSYEGVASSTRYCLFDGKVTMDEYRAFAPNGQMIFIGVSFHVWKPDGSLKTLWLMGGDPGYTLIDGRVEREGDIRRIITTGEGVDSGGEFLERFVRSEQPDRDYRFKMDRSFDGGKTWIPDFSVSDATFASNDVPELPAALHPRMKQAKESAEIARDGMPILDGFAEIELIDRVSDKSGNELTLRFASRYQQPARWRTVYWPLGGDEIEVREQALTNAPSP